MNFKEQTLDQIIENYPEASKVFRDNKLVFCCGTGGNLKLQIACEEAGCDFEKVEKELNQLLMKNLNLSSNQDTYKIIEDINNDYLFKLGNIIPELIFLANKVEKVHQNSVHCPKGLHSEISSFKTELTAHLTNEQDLLRKTSEPSDLKVVIQKSVQEHNKLNSIISEINRITDNTTPPEGACNSWKALYGGLKNLINSIDINIKAEKEQFTKF